MNLFEELNILKVYLKNLGKSIYHNTRLDVFLFIAVVLLLSYSVIINIIYRQSLFGTIRSRQTELLLSGRSMELFGKDLTENLLRDFAAAFPELRVTVLSASGEKDKQPDIFIFDDSEFNSLLSSGALLPLESFYGFETRRLPQALPLVSFMDLLFYNIELLTAAGFDRPPRTRADFLLYARTVSSGNNAALINASGMAMGLSLNDNQAVSRDIFSWIWASGNDFWSDGNNPVINTRAIIQDITFLGNLYRENILAPGSFDITGEQLLDEFARGRIAMMIASSREIPALRERMGDSAFGITTIPNSGLGGRYSIGISNIYAGINANSAHPDAAWAFISFLEGKIPVLCEALKAVPGDVTDLFFGDYVFNDPFYSKARDIFEASRIVHGFSGKPDGEKYETAVREEMQIFFQTGRTAQETANIIQRRWNDISAGRFD